MTQTAPIRPVTPLEIVTYGLPLFDLADKAYDRNFNLTDLDDQAYMASLSYLRGDGLETAQGHLVSEHPSSDSLCEVLAALPNPVAFRDWLTEGWPAQFVARYYELLKETDELDDEQPVARVLHAVFRGAQKEQAVQDNIPDVGVWRELREI